MAITHLSDVTPYPLCWPEGKPRATARKNSPFAVKFEQAVREIYREFERWRVPVDSIVISSNVRPRIGGEPGTNQSVSDPGVAVWWQNPKLKADTPIILRRLACDRHLTVAGNMRAIGKTLEALRGIDRWGAYSAEEAVEGARALPFYGAQKPPARPWWEVLQISSAAEPFLVDAAYKALAKKLHPDGGGSAAAFAELQQAYEQAKSAQPASR